MMKINNLSRKELYDLVWSKPLSTLSIELDISFLDLRKICTDYQISVPKNGHWSKLKFSKPVTIIPFIEDFDGSNMIQYVPKIKSTKELFNFDKEDTNNDVAFNLVLWHGLKGSHIPFPGPTRAAFVYPIVKKED